MIIYINSKMETMKYNLAEFTNMSFNGFNFVVPEETMAIISALSMEVGSPTYIKTPIFQKKELSKSDNNSFNQPQSQMQFIPSTTFKRRRRGNKGMEITNDDWETLRTFQATKIEQKTGIDAQIDQIRLMLNKLTEKTFAEINEKIKIIIDELIEKDTMEEEMTKIGISIFEMASTNKFYSKLYANLYAGLLESYEFLKPMFESNFNSYLDIFKVIECGDPEKDYSRFCDINKMNEKRKAISMFFVNLIATNIVSKDSIVRLLIDLILMVTKYIGEPDKKSEVDELTENIALLYNKVVIDYINGEENDDFLIDDNTISETIVDLAKSKSKDYKSLSNKAIFKYMDLVDM